GGSVGADSGRGSRADGRRCCRAGPASKGTDAPGHGIVLMPAFLLDTNHVGMAVDRASVVGQRIFEARLAGLRLGTCLPVLCEIEAGMRQVRHKVKYRKDLNHLLYFSCACDPST